MNPRLERAFVLLQQSRYELAEKELRQVLADDPNSAMAHGVLAICLAERKKYAEALQASEQAIGLAPEDGFVFYANSIVLEKRNRYPEAHAAIEEAIAIQPDRTEFFAQLSQLHLHQRRWKDALEAADRGLALDPEDVQCTNLRAISLVKLGKTTDAGTVIKTALKRNPEDEVTHANMGWALLEQRQPNKAMEHFREALRLNPELEWARLGIVEAMKARYLIYRLMLSFFLWMMKLSRNAQWGVLIGGYVGFRTLVHWQQNNPEWTLWLIPLIVTYVAFALMTWIASPLFNLALRLNRFGRLALSREQIVASTWVGLCVLSALTCVVLYFSLTLPGALVGALASAFMIPPLANYYNCSPGTPRTWMLVVIATMGFVGFFAAVPRMVVPIAPEPILELLEIPWGLSDQLFVFVALGTQFAVNILVQMQPRH